MRTKPDKLLMAIMRIPLREKEEEDDDAMDLSSFEDAMTRAMVKAIKMTRSPSRTFGSNGGYAAS